MKILTFLALQLLIGTSQAASYHYTIDATAGQTVTYDRGSPSITSLGPSTYISLEPHQDGKRIKLMVFVANSSETAFEFSEASIVATVGGQPIELVTAAKLKKEAKREAAMQSAAVGLAAGINSGNAGRSTYSGTVATSTPYGRTTGAATYSGTITDSAAQQRAIAQSSDQTRKIATERTATLERIDSMSLERTTIEPRESVFGVVAIKPPKPRGKQPIQIKIEAGGDVHLINLRETKE